jgi:hypothetical protein
VWEFVDAVFEGVKMERGKSRALAMLCLGLVLAGALACNRGAGSSPTATMKAFFEATRKKDAEGFKRTLSKGSLDTLEVYAKAQNKTLDELLTSGIKTLDASQSSATPAMRNEKIEGETATLEVEDGENGEWRSIPFVRENGEWKIAFDKALREAQEKRSASRGVN